MSKYNLLLFQGADGTPHIADYLTIRHMMAGLAPEINVYIVGQNAPVPPETFPRIAERPTLLFSPKVIEIPPGLRGARLAASRSTKAEQAEWFFKAGIPHPLTKMITPKTTIDEASYGPFTVVKPDKGNNGAGIHLVRTSHVKWRPPDSFPRNDARWGLALLAQQFINTGPYSRSYRVFTVLGHPIYSIASEATDKIQLPDPAGTDPVDLDVVAVQSANHVLTLAYDEDVLELAKLVHQKFPQFPALGIDIVREHDTRRLFVLEMHPSGGAWHISSPQGLGHQSKYRLDLYGQFDALRTIAKALIETTRAMAK